MPIKLMLFSILLSALSFADSGEKIVNGYDPKVDIISENYEAGPFLIYDCQEGHWTCVLESYYKDCEEKRAKDVHEKKLELSCAPIGELPNKKSCFQKQLFLVSQNHGTRFCIGDDWKQKEVEF
jgi:hypothetical protein